MARTAIPSAARLASTRTARNAKRMFTRYCGFNSVFPTGGYTTSVDFYLVTADSPLGSDIRFDWSSAICSPRPEQSSSWRLRMQRQHDRQYGGDGISALAKNTTALAVIASRDAVQSTTTGYYTYRNASPQTSADVIVMTPERARSGATVDDDGRQRPDGPHRRPSDDPVYGRSN